MTGLLVLANSFALASGKVLQGQIVHSDSIPALDKRMRVGETFDKSLVSTEGNERLNFYQIPEWIAGTYSLHEIIQTSYFDYATNHQSNEVIKRAVKQDNITWGTIRDAQNRFWEEDHSPISQFSENLSDNSYIYGVIKENFPVSNSPQAIVMQSTNLNTQVDKTTNKIKLIINLEEFSKYTPTGDGNVRIERSIKAFSPEGKPLALTTDYGILQRTGPMPVPANKAEVEKDLAIFLKQYSK